MNHPPAMKVSPQIWGKIFHPSAQSYIFTGCIYTREWTIILKVCSFSRPPYERPSEHTDVVLQLSGVLIQGTAEMKLERRVALCPSTCSSGMAVA